MNKYRDHIVVIPEDRKDEQIANGFVNHEQVDARRIGVTPVAGGWKHVLSTFETEYIRYLRDYPFGHVVMLIDFDGQGAGRLANFAQAIPDDLKGRVFVLGSSHNPEALKAALNLPLERIGRQLAEDCARGGGGLWDHEQVQHNAEERQRLATVVQAFVFS